MAQEDLLKWEYLRQTEPRGKKFFEIIQPYIRNCESMIDMNCGFSPLKPYIKNYFGFDKYYGENKCSDSDIEVKHYDLLILAGATNGRYELDSTMQEKTFERFIEFGPSVIVIESSKRIRLKLLDLIILKHGYTFLKEEVYDAEFKNHHRYRKVRIYDKSGND